MIPLWMAAAMHNKKFLTPMEDADLAKPSADTTDRCELDAILRARGYTIIGRPNGGDPVWEKAGIPFTQADVLMLEGLV